jgi:6-pyruvoyltetrahydropterin/6-carboxytetrahydropterin synthase
MKDLKAILNRTVIDQVDHRHLNIEVPWLEGIIPTAENLARTFFERAARELPDGVELIALTVHETERNSATYTRD